jgi:hypothetical protein
VPTTTTTPTTAPTTTTQPNTTTDRPTALPPGSGDAVAFVESYYALLPGNTDAAWQLLSPTAQSASGGRSGFDSFYARFQSVSLSDVRSVGDNSVEATVTFVPKDGSTTHEPYRFALGTDSNGQTIIESFAKL